MSEFFMRFPGGRKKALTLSYDDGLQTDARLLSIMQANGLKGTFNINSGLYAPEGTVYEKHIYHRRMSKREATELYGGSGMEVAVHSLTHPFLEQLASGTCCYEIIADRKNLEDQFGTLVRGMAYPYGTYNNEVTACLQKCGILYARTTEASHSFAIPDHWLKLPATCHHNDPMLEPLTERFLQEEPEKAPWLFYLWGHSSEFERDNNWEVIENFAEKTGGREDIWYATNMEIFEYIASYGRLVYSADGSRVYNPSAVTLYYAVNDGNFGWPIRSIGPGQTQTLF